ncbi:14395_t:CDS:2, partial [Cetraspora pellucida]
ISNRDEISQYLDSRWVSASEACWRIFGFDMSHIYPSVIRLQIHLPNQQNITFSEKSNLSNVLADEQNQKTMLTEYFEMNKIDTEAKNYTYLEFPRYYVWNQTAKKWTKRNQGKTIGRIYTVNPIEGERYYLRILLNNVKGATSFNDLKIINGYQCSTFKDSALKRKLIESERMYYETMYEAAQFQMPSMLRQLFVTILLFGEPNNIRFLWDNNYIYMSEDFAKNGIPDGQLRINAVLLHIKHLLEQHHKCLNDFDLPTLILPYDLPNELPRLILNELNIPY